jgi:hypothetical protein
VKRREAAIAGSDRHTFDVGGAHRGHLH